ncbi:hypothetical protein ACP70R_040014 [Stipagrostis hirtigluma subsp. patula]
MLVVKLPNIAGVAAPGNAPALVPHIPAPTVRIYNAANPGYVVTIKHDAVVLAPDNHRDTNEHWHMIPHYDAEGRDVFIIVNKGTKQAIQRPAAEGQQVRLVPHNNCVLDSSLLWTKKKVGKDLWCICEVDNNELVLDAVLRGTEIVVVASKYKEADSQKWTIKPDIL